MKYKPNQKKLRKPPQNKEGYTKKKKGLYKYNNTNPNAFRSKANYIG